MGKKTIAVFGTGRAGAGDEAYELAYELCGRLARAGFVVANGGYGGTMLAGAKAAAQAGGEVIGVTCTAFGRGGANEYITTEIATGSLEERLDTLIGLADGYVALPGGTGTLLELAKVWEMKNKGFFSADRPIILLGDFWRPLVELVGKDDAAGGSCVRQVNGPEDAVAVLSEIA